jgi:3'(2'), 5'-bisphosphate nucleotidase
VTTTHDIPRLREAFARMALAAGRAIMTVYDGPIAVADKSDGSPTTAADAAAEAIILAELARVLRSPRCSRRKARPRACPALADVFVAVDPLDGTREFINRNGEFTVNIALIERGVPTAGVVYAPALGRLWLGGAGEAFTLACPPSTPPSRKRAPAHPDPPGAGGGPRRGREPLAPRREHAAFLERLPIAARRSTGSSLKFCLVAEGEADVYPRFGPTMEWDTAAGHAVVAAAGGRVVTPEGEPFVYGKTGSGYRNGSFVVWGR